MNKTNPFMQHGSLQDQKERKRARFRLAVYSVFGFTTLLMMFFLIQGCKKEPAPETQLNLGAPEDTNNTPAMSPTNVADTNIPALTPPPGASNTAPVSNVPPVIPMTPPPTPPAAPEVPAGGKTYVVVKGDSFSTIAKKLGVKVKDIEALNPGVVPTKIKVNQKLTVPDSTTVNTSAPTATDSASEAYTVKPGDSLFKIAKAHGTTVKAIHALNGLKTDSIKAGQKLKLPSKAIPAETTAPTTPSIPAPTAASNTVIR